MEQIVLGILDAIAKNEFKNFFKNLEDIFKKVYISSYEFGAKSSSCVSEDAGYILFDYLCEIIKASDQLNDRENENGTISRALITWEAVIPFMKDNRYYYTSYFIKAIYKLALRNDLISRKELLIAHLWINLSGSYERIEE